MVLSQSHLYTSCCWADWTELFMQGCTYNHYSTNKKYGLERGEDSMLVAQYCHDAYQDVRRRCAPRFMMKGSNCGGSVHDRCQNNIRLPINMDRGSSGGKLTYACMYTLPSTVHTTRRGNASGSGMYVVHDQGLTHYPAHERHLPSV